MKNIIHQLEKGCFSTMSWEVGGLRYGEKLISIEVSRKLREDDFFSVFWQEWKIGDGPIVFQIVQVKWCFFEKWYYNGLFKNRGSGITMASLKTEGKTPVCRDWLIMAVTAGSSWSKHSTKRNVGIGSNEQVSWEDFKILFLTHWIDTSWNEQNGDLVYGSSVSKFSAGIWLSNSFLIVLTF